MVCRFPKRIVICNMKIQLFDRVLVGLFASILVVRFFAGRRYERPVLLQGVGNLWIEKQNVTEELARIALAQAQEETPCYNPRQYDYWFDSSGAWRYENYTCLRFCQKNEAAWDCQSEFETSFQTSPSEVMLATSVLDVVLASGAPGSVHRSRPSNYFMAALDNTNFGLDFSFQAPNSYFYTSPGDAVQARTYHAEAVHIVLLDKNDEGFKFMSGIDRFAEDGYIHLHLSDLMSAVGISFDDASPDAGPNQMPSLGNPRYATGPVLRISGFEIDIHVDCHNFEAHPISKAFGVSMQVGIDTPICYIKPKMSTATWVNHVAYEALDITGAVRLRTAYGLKIAMTVGGAFTKPDPVTTVSDLTSAVVLMRLPEKIVLLFTIYCLGKLSLIYRRVIFEEFSVTEQCAGMTMRLMSHSIGFIEARDTNVAGKGDVISKRSVGVHLRHILHRREMELNDDELGNLVDFCCHSVSRPQVGPVSMSKSFKALTSRSTSSMLDEKTHVIDVDEYSSAICSIERLDFDNLISLFDADRKRGALETFFTPRQLNRTLEASMELTVERRRLKERKGSDGNLGAIKEATKTKVEDLDQKMQTFRDTVSRHARLLDTFKGHVIGTTREMEEKVRAAQLRVAEVAAKLRERENADEHPVIVHLRKSCVTLLETHNALEGKVVSTETNNKDLRTKLDELQNSVKGLLDESAKRRSARAATGEFPILSSDRAVSNRPNGDHCESPRGPSFARTERFN